MNNLIKYLNCIGDMDISCEYWLIMPIVSLKGVLLKNENVLYETISVFRIFV